MFLVHWLVADPSYEISETQDDWAYVLGFSAAILSLAFAIPMFARLAIGRVGFRVSLIAGTGAALSSVANILEDGLHMGWASSDLYWAGPCSNSVSWRSRLWSGSSVAVANDCSHSSRPQRWPGSSST